MAAKIRMIITDVAGKTADREVEMTDVEWALLLDAHKGWEKRKINPNPLYDPEAPEDPVDNPAFLDVVDDRWHIVDQAQKHFERLYRSSADRMAKLQAGQAVEAQADLARSQMSVTDLGDVQ